jgi:hypothetical protein
VPGLTLVQELSARWMDDGGVLDMAVGEEYKVAFPLKDG